MHPQRIKAFSNGFDVHPKSGLSFGLVAFGRNAQDTSARRIAEAIRDIPDLAAVYNAGGVNSALLRVLHRAKRKVFFVGHELADTTRAALESGTADVILYHAPEAQVRRAIDLLLARIGLLYENV